MRETLCFYEPFHEGLARANRRRIERNTSLAWNSHHPRLERPYWDEYLPLLRRGIRQGVRGYRSDFAVAGYFPFHAGPGPEAHYLKSLLEHARGRGKQAVLGFSRSLARARAMKHSLGGYHIVIQRDRRQQWLSCRSYRIEDGSVYFELGHFMILALAPPGSPAARFADRLRLPRPPPGSFRRQSHFLRDALGEWTDELSYRAFLAVLLMSQACALPAADLTIDMDRLSHSASYRKAIHATVLLNTGLDVGLHDCRIHRHDTRRVDLDFAAIEADVLATLRACGANPPEGLVDERGAGSSEGAGISEVPAAAVDMRAASNERHFA